MPILDDGTPVSGASASEMTISYAEIAAEVGDLLGIGRTQSSWSSIEDDRVDSIIKSGLRQVYYPQREAGSTYTWSWMRPEAKIVTTAAYDTGTIEIALGVVTLSGGVWPDWADEGELHIGSQIYTVKTRDSDTQVTLDDLTVSNAAGATYSLSRPSYDLPAGFDGNFDGNLHYKTGDNTLWPSIVMVSPSMLRGKKQIYNETDRPLYAAVQPKPFVAVTGQRWQITFHPSPNGSYTFYGRYMVRPAMIDNTDKYPLGGSAMAEVFLESCLAVAEKRFIEDTQIHQKEFQQLLIQAIDHDANAFSADFLGYNSDNSECADLYHNGRRVGNAIHSYEGVVYYD